jgi:uncharacterized protein (TIRG00374 family)
MIGKDFISIAHLNVITYGKRSQRKLFRILLWSLIPIVLWWTLKDISIIEIIDNFRGIGLEAIVVLIGLNTVIFALFSLRWWLILRAQGYRRSFLALTSYRLAGFGVTYFTPGPQFGGEPLQVYLLNQREGMKTSTAAASVTVDKLLELLANFTFLLVGITVILFAGTLKGATRIELILLPALLLIVPAAYLVALKLGFHPVSSILRVLGDRFLKSPRIDRFFQTLKETENQVSVFCQKNTLVLLTAAFLSVGIWVLMILEFSLMLRFLGVGLNLTQVLIALTAARIAFLLPLPAGLGTLEAGQVMAMGLIGVNPVFGVSLSLLIRARDVILGSIGLWLGGVYSR